MSQTSVKKDYFHFESINTRWHDNDLYGHVNNVVYYSFFDTVVNNYLIKHGQLDVQHHDVVGFVVNSNCNYFAPIAYPESIDVGLRLNKISNKSVEYGLAIFKQGQNQAVAEGHFTHVFVSRKSGKSVPIPSTINQALLKIKYK